MRDIEQKTTKALAQFTKDLEAGDLSEYQITKWVTCPVCGGGSHPVIGCVECDGRGSLKIVVQEGKR